MTREELKSELQRLNAQVLNSLPGNKALDDKGLNEPLAVLEKSLLMLCAILNPDWTVDDLAQKYIQVPIDDVSLSMVLWSLNRLTDQEVASIASMLNEECF